MYEQSHRVISALVICIIVCCHGLLIIAVMITIAYAASATKMPVKLANAAITDMQMRQREVLLRSMQNTRRVNPDAKAENDALRDDVAAGRHPVAHPTVCQSVREATTASGVDNAASRLADTAEQGLFHSERLITMQKQLEGTQKYINGQDEVAHIEVGNSCNYCEQYTRASSGYKCLK